MIERDAHGFRRGRTYRKKKVPYWGSVSDDMSDVTVMALPPEMPVTPERRLLAAVLGEAIIDLESGRILAHDNARKWVASGISGTISFNELCDGLGFDPAAWRERMLLIQPGAGALRPSKFGGVRTRSGFAGTPTKMRERRRPKRRSAWAKLGG